jgi:hypothetical protein
LWVRASRVAAEDLAMSAVLTVFMWISDGV